MINKTKHDRKKRYNRKSFSRFHLSMLSDISLDFPKVLRKNATDIEDYHDVYSFGSQYISDKYLRNVSYSKFTQNSEESIPVRYSFHPTLYVDTTIYSAVRSPIFLKGFNLVINQYNNSTFYYGHLKFSINANNYFILGYKNRGYVFLDQDFVATTFYTSTVFLTQAHLVI